MSGLADAIGSAYQSDTVTLQRVAIANSTASFTLTVLTSLPLIPAQQLVSQLVQTEALPSRAVLSTQTSVTPVLEVILTVATSSLTSVDMSRVAAGVEQVFDLPSGSLLFTSAWQDSAGIVKISMSILAGRTDVNPTMAVIQSNLQSTNTITTSTTVISIIFPQPPTPPAPAWPPPLSPRAALRPPPPQPPPPIPPANATIQIRISGIALGNISVVGLPDITTTISDAIGAQSGQVVVASATQNPDNSVTITVTIPPGSTPVDDALLQQVAVPSGIQLGLTTPPPPASGNLVLTISNVLGLDSIDATILANLISKITSSPATVLSITMSYTNPASPVAVIIVQLATPPSPDVINNLDPAEISSQLIAAGGVSRSAVVSGVASPPAPPPPPPSTMAFTLKGAAGIGAALVIGAVLSAGMVSSAAAQKPVAVGRRAAMTFGPIRL